jgi:hypothetical protein
VAVAVSVVIGLPVIPAGSLNGPVLATNEEPGEQAGRPALAATAGGPLGACAGHHGGEWCLGGGWVLALPVLAPSVSTAAARCAGLGRHGGRSAATHAAGRVVPGRGAWLDTNLALTSRPLFQRVL